MIRSRFSALIRWAPSLFFWTMVFAPSVHGVELGEGLQAHGFISQGMSLTSDNNFGGNSDSGPAWDLREAGANLSWRPTPDWLVSGQALARWAGETDNGDLRLDYGFVDRTLLADGETQMGVRLGKLKNPLGFYNTTRDVAHTRPGIIMPQSIYMDRGRNFWLVASGLSLYGNREHANNAVSWQISAFEPEVDDSDLNYLMLGRDFGGEFHGRSSWLGQIMYEREGGLWRAGLSLGDLAIKYRPGVVDPFNAGHTDLSTWVLSLEHNSENWSVTAEYGQTKVRSREYGIPIVERDNTTEAWYVQATRRFPGDWQVFLRYDVFYFDKSDHSGEDFASIAGANPWIRYAKDWTLGVRKDIDRWTLSAEWHQIDGTAWLSPADTPYNQQSQEWDLLLLQAAWRF